MRPAYQVGLSMQIDRPDGPALDELVRLAGEAVPVLICRPVNGSVAAYQCVSVWQCGNIWLYGSIWQYVRYCVLWIYGRISNPFIAESTSCEKRYKVPGLKNDSILR